MEGNDYSTTQSIVVERQFQDEEFWDSNPFRWLGLVATMWDVTSLVAALVAGIVLFLFYRDRLTEPLGLVIGVLTAISTLSIVSIVFLFIFIKSLPDRVWKDVEASGPSSLTIMKVLLDPHMMTEQETPSLPERPEPSPSSLARLRKSVGDKLFSFKAVLDPPPSASLSFEDLQKKCYTEVAGSRIEKEMLGELKNRGLIRSDGQSIQLTWRVWICRKVTWNRLRRFLDNLKKAQKQQMGLHMLTDSQEE